MLQRIRFVRLVVTLALCGLIAAVVAAEVASLPPANPLLKALKPDGLNWSRQQLANPDTGAALENMVRQLEAQHQPVPAYLRMVSDEYNVRSTQSARFAVGCYWEGERELGKLAGVLACRTGTVGSDEVVEVRFNPQALDLKSLTSHVQQLQCFRGIPATQPALTEATEQHHTLAYHHEFDGIPLTPLQQTRLNSALFEKTDLALILSPAQLRMIKY